MHQQRNNEKKSPASKKTSRTSRGYEVNGLWYFELRGGGQKGPYDNELQMRASLNEFIEFHNQMNQEI